MIFPPQNLKAAMFLHLKTIVGDTLVDDRLVNEKGGLDETSEDKKVAVFKEFILFLHLDNSLSLIIYDQ